MRALRQIILFVTFGTAMVLSACAPKPGTTPIVPQGPQTYTPQAITPRQTQAFNYEQPVGRTVKVALLIPATGRNADLGRAMQDAATLALYDKYAALSPTQAAIRVEILPKDTGDSVEMAKTAAQSAIDDGAEIILGPIFSDAVSVAAPIARAANRQMISFSNNEAVAGPGVYVFGFTPESQTAKVVEYALSKKMQVGALVPNDVLGQKVLGVAKQQALAKEEAIAPVSLYMPQGLAVDASVDALLKDKVRFDALFIPAVGPTLDTLLRTLAARGVSPATTQLLGTGMWDDPAIIRAHNIEGGLLASSPPDMTQGFVTRFKNAYGYMPPRIASLAYDAVALTVTLATNEKGFGADALTSPSGYSGPANGIFRFTPEGRIERGLSILRIRGGRFETVVPAPTMFK